MTNNEPEYYDLDAIIRELEHIAQWRPRKMVHFSPEVEKFFTLTPRYWSQEIDYDFTLVKLHSSINSSLP